MKKFIFVYEGGKDPKTNEEGKILMNNWTAWFSTLGAKVLEDGFPTMPGAMVVDGLSVRDSSLPMAGYSVIQAVDFDEAVRLAKTCPHILTSEGKVHVLEEMQMG